MPGRSRRRTPASLMAWATRTSRCASPSSSINSIVAPSNAADFFASATRWAGVPWEAASPREQTTKCAARPVRVSLAITPPHPNSMSSGCAPKARHGAGSGVDFGAGFIGTVNGITVYKSDIRRFFLSKVGLFACSGNVMRAVQDGLHPAEPGVARGADLLPGEGGFGQRHERISAFVQRERWNAGLRPGVFLSCATDACRVGDRRSSVEASAHDFTFIRNIHEKFRHVTSCPADGRVARTYHADSLKQTHAAIHLKTEIGDEGGRDFLKNIDQGMTDVIRQLEQRFVLPARGNVFEVKRGKFPLNPVFKGEVELGRFIGLAMAQNGLRFTRVMVAVVAKKDDFAAGLRLQAPGRLAFCKKETSREQPARLLAETNDWRGGHDLDGAGAIRSPGPSNAWRTALNSTQAAHPIRLYQR